MSVDVTTEKIHNFIFYLQGGFGHEINAFTYKKVQNDSVLQKVMYIGFTVAKYQVNLAKVLQ